jgi:hypothetical protein
MSFLNVDLEIGARARTPLAPLLTVLEASLFELFRGRLGGRYRAHFEITGQTRDASATIRALAAVIEGLAPGPRRAWNAATLRDFNVGVELERGPGSTELAIEADAVRRVAALGGRIVFTASPAAPAKKPRIKKP